jgi:hypothetical protein
VLLALSMSAVVEARAEQAIGLLDEYLASADSVGEATTRVLMARLYRGVARIDAGDRAGIDEARAATEQLRQVGFFELTVVLENLAAAYRTLGDLGATRALAAEAIAQQRSPQQWRSLRAVAEQAFDHYLMGDWESALAAVVECQAGIEAGRNDTEATGEWMGTQARILARRGDLDAASAVEAEALQAARAEFTPQAMCPELAESAWLAATRGDKAAAVGLLRELLALTDDQPVLVGALPYLPAELPETAHQLGVADELTRQLESIRLETPWRTAMLASLGGDHATAARAYADMGAATYAAFAHLRAADATASSDPDAAADHLRRATEFSRSVSASLYLTRLGLAQTAQRMED